MAEKRLIDVDELKKEIFEENPLVYFEPFGYIECSPNCKYGDKVFPRDRIFEIVDSAPTVDAVEMVHGRWEYNETKGWFECSNCRKIKIDPDQYETILESGCWNYCPNCGAKMDGERRQNED